MTPRFEIGDEVWWAAWESSEDRLTCPDCCGEGRIRCIMGDGTEVSVECETCRCGYEPSRGYVTVYTRKPMAIPTTIVGMSIEGDKIEWRTEASYIVEDERLFRTEDDAREKANEIAAEADRAERERIAHKEKPTHSWAWNATYHRREIRDAERKIEYHRSKLEVANLKARQERRAKNAG